MSAMMFSFNLYPLRVWIFSMEAHLAITFDTIFRFVAPGGSGSYYELTA